MRVIGTEVRRRRWTRWVLATSFPVALTVALAAEMPWAQARGREIYMAAVEMKGGTQKEKEPYPEAPLPPGAAYIKTPPNPAGPWGVSAYQSPPAPTVAPHALQARVRTRCSVRSWFVDSTGRVSLVARTGFAECSACRRRKAGGRTACRPSLRR